ncbi:MAG: GNAT family N-acetyltransferase [Pseudonocardiaceae bacterium]
MRWLVARRNSRTANAGCHQRGHVLQSELLVFRTPTNWEMVAAVAAASDPAAQRWLGWSTDQIVPRASRKRWLAVVPGKGSDYNWSPHFPLVTIHRTKNRCSGMVTIRESERGYEIGGWLAPQFRGRGLGPELFRAGLIFAHDHLGIQQIYAGTEDANVTCRRALSAAGFISTDGPVTHVLPDGRTIPPCWYRHDSAETRCCQGPQPLPT